jgi:hypothetical protein
VGRVTFTPGKRGLAFVFDGSSWIESPVRGFPIAGMPRTLALWARIDKVVAEEALFAGYGAFGGANQVFMLGATVVSSARPSPFFSQWGEAIVGPQTDLGVWRHIAVTYQQGIARLFIDGCAAGSRAFALETAAASMFVGKLPGGHGEIRRLVGAVDDIRLYDRLLSAREIELLAAP